jgi:hypothetical protein
MMATKEDREKPLYIGSTVNMRTRQNSHRNPNAKHGPFGRWMHGNRKTEDIVMIVLEEIRDWPDDNKSLKALLRKKEFEWKAKMPEQPFGQMDGLMYQPVDIRNEYIRKRNVEYRQKPEVRKRENIRKSKPEYKQQKNAKQRARYEEDIEYREKRLARKCNYPKKKVYEITDEAREKRNASARECYRKKMERENKKYIPRGRRGPIKKTIKKLAEMRI